MSAITVVFPHQLYRDNPAVEKSRKVFVIEEFLFFRQFSFHKQKLVLHRASMKFYAHHLTLCGYEVEYVNSNNNSNDIRNFVETTVDVEEIHVVNPSDNWLQKRLKNACAERRIKVVSYPSPNFINNTSKALQFFQNKKSFSQTSFYIAQRKENGLLIDLSGKPQGGKWTYDEENRKKFPSSAKAPQLNWPEPNQWVNEARTYVEKYFPNNYGSITFNASDQHFYPVTFSEAVHWLDDFIINRFQNFGVYEDAIVANENFINHSILTPVLNTGLLNPDYVINRVLHSAEALNIPLNSVEGFLRQIIGWREFMHLVYINSGTKQRNANYWKFSRKIPKSFWLGKTGIFPLDQTIHKVLKTGYCHHIERLMILGNFMLLCEFDPNEVYNWFMELFIDAYDWVMVPNIYGMSQFADGGLMSTKPYLSSSNYILKMSNYPKGEWQQTWDGLFWRFIDKHQNFFAKNPRLSMMVKMWDKMPADKKGLHLINAANFLARLDKEDITFS